MIFRRVGRRLTLINAVVIAAIVVLVGVAIVVVLHYLLTVQEAANLRVEAAQARGEVLDGDDDHDGDNRLGDRLALSGTFYVIWTPAGRVRTASSYVRPADLRAPVASALRGLTTTGQIDLPGGGDVLVVTEPVYRSGRLAAVLQLGESFTTIDRIERASIIVVATAAVAGVGLALLASRFLAGRALVPIRGALERQREFTADASHELRTPLSIIDTGVQVLARHPDQTVAENREVLDALRQQTAHMTALLESLLLLARADSGQAELQLVEVPVTDLLRTVSGEMELVAGTRIELVPPPADPGAVVGDRSRLRQLLLILLDNAAKHAPADSAVELSALRQERQITLTVADHGPGIPPDQRTRVFERFHRLDGGTPGTGLGLSIARWIVVAHGGSIALEDNRPGLVVRVQLPVAGPRPLVSGKG